MYQDLHGKHTQRDFFGSSFWYHFNKSSPILVFYMHLILPYGLLSKWCLDQKLVNGFENSSVGGPLLSSKIISCWITTFLLVFSNQIKPINGPIYGHFITVTCEDRTYQAQKNCTGQSSLLALSKSFRIFFFFF